MKTYRPLIITASSIAGFILVLGGGYYLGQQQQMDHAESKLEPEKRLSAKPGTERKNAQALTSTQRKVESTETEKDPDIPEWGSLEAPTKPKVLTRTERAAQEAEEAQSPEESITVLLKRLAAMEGNKQKSLLYATLSTYYRNLDPPMLDEAEKALELSWKYATTLIEKVDVAYFQADYHMARRDYEKVLATIDRLQTDSLPLTEHALDLSMMMGIAYEQLDYDDDAQAAYKNLMGQAKAIGVNSHPAVANVYRQAAMNLAQMYRDEGKELEAQALGRSVSESFALQSSSATLTR